MEKAEYNAKERHHVFRTVNGPKWMRKKMEKHVFAGEISAERIRIKEQWPAEFDMQGYVDDTYFEGLLADTKNYREREFDPEEIHTNQMRELVTLCEIEMAHMRDRLDECQGHLRDDMHILANRLHHVDAEVHRSLSLLHFLAGSAGVPTKKEHGHVADGRKLKDTYQRIMQHLAQGPVRQLETVRTKHQAELKQLCDARAQNDTYSRIHTNARLANAFGVDDKKRVARQHAMEKDPSKKDFGSPNRN